MKQSSKIAILMISNSQLFLTWFWRKVHLFVVSSSEATTSCPIFHDAVSSKVTVETMPESEALLSYGGRDDIFYFGQAAPLKKAMCPVSSGDVGRDWWMLTYIKWY